VDLVEGYSVMAGYDNLIFGAGVPGLGSNGILKGDERLVKSVKVKGETEKAEIKVVVEEVAGDGVKV
jgi:hypothetical protein